MSRYTGPKGRINRRLGAVIFESGGATRSLERRSGPPGMANSRHKLSTYGQSLREKQKIKYYYGLGERQLRRLFDHARRSKGNTGEALLLLCERRLDNVVREAGFATTRPQARQGVSHGHFTVNGRHTDVASMIVRPGDVIHVKRRANLASQYAARVKEYDGQVPNWLAVDADQLAITVLRLPTADEITLPVEVGMVVELLSR